LEAAFHSQFIPLSMITQEKQYTISEVAEILRLSKRSVERFIEKHELKYYRFGRRIVISETQLNAFAEKKRIKYFWMSAGDLPELSFDSY
jgi:excisionase family DNA binding protein